ncbi:MAG: hypothetical protein IPK75_14085 [Acidobacteria bacterium]|nr:hypothetical protein [Acidobacteriota bacterium]
MNCIFDITGERTRLDNRDVSAAFHLAVIDEALKLIAAHVASSEGDAAPELREACEEARESIAELRARAA